MSRGPLYTRPPSQVCYLESSAAPLWGLLTSGVPLGRQQSTGTGTRAGSKGKGPSCPPVLEPRQMVGLGKMGAEQVD